MRTNLKYLAEAAGSAVEGQLENPVLSPAEEHAIKESGRKILAGFETYDGVVADNTRALSLKNRRAGIEAFKNDRDAVVADLETRGITPLAVLPRGAWESICAKTGLFMLAPDDAGTIAVSTDCVADVDRLASNHLEVLRFWGMATLVMFSVVLTAATFLWLGTWPAVSIGVAAAVAVVAFGIIYVDANGQGRDFFFTGWHDGLVRRILRKLDSLPAAELLKKYFPNGSSPAYSEVRTKLSLPPAPQNVTEVLLKAQGLTLRTAAVGEAVGIEEMPSQIFARYLDRRELAAAERRQRDWEDFLQSLFDPIIYVERGNAVAIIAQFGDFPVEKQAVDTALFSEHLL